MFCLLVRHGTAEHNVDRFFSSQPEHPRYRPSHLTAAGRVEVMHLRQQLDGFFHSPSYVFCSPLPRAYETARILAQGVAHAVVTHDPRLTESHAGDVEGLAFEAVNNEYDLSDHGGETPEALDQRLQGFLEDPRTWQNTSFIVVVTHASPAEALQRVMGLSDPVRLPPGGARLLEKDGKASPNNNAWQAVRDWRPL